VEVWQTSDVRRLRLGEEKKKDRRRNHRAKIQCPHLLRRAAINNSVGGFGEHVIGHKSRVRRDTHAVAAPHGFACVVIPRRRRSYIFPLSSKPVQLFWNHGQRGSKFGHYHYFGCWLLQQFVLPCKPCYRTTLTDSGIVCFDSSCSPFFTYYGRPA